MILLRIEATKDRTLPESLNVLAVEIEGSIGCLLCRALRGIIPDMEVAAVLTQVLVDLGFPILQDMP